MSTDLPFKPKLRGYYRLRSVEPDQLLFRSGVESVLLRGTSVQDLLPLLLEHLNGQNTTSTIVAKLPQVDPDVVIQALHFLNDHKLLEDAATLPPPTLDAEALARVEYQTTFWLSVQNDRYACQDSLAGSKVAVLGLGGVGSIVAHTLAVAGLGRMLLADEQCVDVADQQFNPYYVQDDVGRERASVVREKVLRVMKAENVESLAQIPAGPQDLGGMVSGCDLVVLCSDTGETSLRATVNEACVGLGIPFISGFVDQHRGEFGPLVVPRQSPCYVCYELRRKANAESTQPETEFVITPQGAVHRTEGCLLTPFAGLIGHHLALEAIKQLTGFSYPSTIGRTCLVNFFTMEATYHDILKLPRCPCCGPARKRPQAQIWEIFAPQQD